MRVGVSTGFLGKRPDLVALVHLALGQHEAHGALHGRRGMVCRDDNNACDASEHSSQSSEATQRGPRRDLGIEMVVVAAGTVAGWLPLLQLPVVSGYPADSFARRENDNNRPILKL